MRMKITPSRKSGCSSGVRSACGRFSTVDELPIAIRRSLRYV
jgi:hypothetical protein